MTPPDCCSNVTRPAVLVPLLGASVAVALVAPEAAIVAPAGASLVVCLPQFAHPAVRTAAPIATAARPKVTRFMPFLPFCL